MKDGVLNISLYLFLYTLVSTDALEFPVCLIQDPADDNSTAATTASSKHTTYTPLSSDSDAVTTPTTRTSSTFSQVPRSSLSPQAAMLLKLSKRARSSAAYQQYKLQKKESTTRR